MSPDVFDYAMVSYLTYDEALNKRGVQMLRSLLLAVSFLKSLLTGWTSSAVLNGICVLKESDFQPRSEFNRAQSMSPLTRTTG